MDREGATPEGEPGITAAASASLSGRTISAAKWRFAATVVQGGLQFAVGILLARLLEPDAFGVVAIAWVVLGFAMLVGDLGLGPAVIQRRDLTERHLRVAFTASVGMGAGLALILIALSPLSGVLLRGNGLLAPVLCVQSLLFVLGGVGGTARSLLRRQLRFKGLFWTGTLSYVIGYAGVATGMALAGFGVWSLVWGAVMQALIDNVLVLALARHPVRPLLARRELRELFGFGAGATLNNVVNFAARNGDNVIVGRWLGALALGLYGRAYNLMTLPLNYLGVATHQVLFPAMAEIQHDRERLGRVYLMSVQMTTLVAAPVMAGMIVAGPHMVTALYGPNWSGMVLPLQILCAAGIFRSVYHLAGAVTYASGQVYAELRKQVVYTVLVVAGGLAGTFWGVSGVAAGVNLAIVYMYFAMSGLALRIVARSWTEFWIAQLPGVAVGAIVAGAALVVRLALEGLGLGSGVIFLALLAACALALPAALYLLPTRVRPADLFARVSGSFGRLPPALKHALERVLRIPVTVHP